MKRFLSTTLITVRIWDTVLFQIQEMLRAERITDLDKIHFEVETYNELLADNGDLSATMLIEISEQDQIRPQIEKLIGIDTAAVAPT
jgi:hypothetical protein